jgi:hypothetical protein
MVLSSNSINTLSDQLRYQLRDQVWDQLSDPVWDQSWAGLYYNLQQY